MNGLRKRPLAALLVSILVCVIFVATAFMLSIPPWNHRGLQKFHFTFGELTGLYLHRFPDDYSGSVTFWRSGEEREERFYIDGKRHGFWRRYASDGTLENECEYRFGRPWNGSCQIFEFKAFTAYYEDGIRMCK